MRSLLLPLLLSFTACSLTTPDTTGSLRHVVLFKFKSDTSADKIAEVEDAFATLRHRIPEITGFEWGTDISVENKAAGFTHCFLVTFANAQGRDSYLPHPAHREFVKLVGPVLDNVLVFDYQAR